MESIFERLAPERLADLAAEVGGRFEAELSNLRSRLDAAPPPSELAALGQRLREGCGYAERCVAALIAAPGAPGAHRIPLVLGAMHELARAEESFYALRQALPMLAGRWPAPTETPDRPGRGGEEEPPTGIVHVSRGGHHGGFSLYVPEHYDGDRDWSLVVALHGGSGNGRDFLWTWLREAKRSGHVLLAPTAAEGTWSEIDDRGLLEVLAWVRQRYRINAARTLLTGLSDGATFTLLHGLLHPEVYRALAPLCGVLHPANEALGNLERARGVPIYLVHGALDFLFPVETARFARDTLRAAGAELVYRELSELSHTYPRSENDRILAWFAGLAEPAP